MFDIFGYVGIFFTVCFLIIAVTSLWGYQISLMKSIRYAKESKEKKDMYALYAEKLKGLILSRGYVTTLQNSANDITYHQTKHTIMLSFIHWCFAMEKTNWNGSEGLLLQTVFAILEGDETYGTFERWLSDVRAFIEKSIQRKLTDQEWNQCVTLEPADYMDLEKFFPTK